jgi:hypothetical protein
MAYHHCTKNNMHKSTKAIAHQFIFPVVLWKCLPFADASRFPHSPISTWKQVATCLEPEGRKCIMISTSLFPILYSLLLPNSQVEESEIMPSSLPFLNPSIHILCTSWISNDKYLSDTYAIFLFLFPYLHPHHFHTKNVDINNQSWYSSLTLRNLLAHYSQKAPTICP